MIAKIADINEIQRLRFTPGQDLLARDFRDGETFASRLREFHTRALHAAFGVSLGLRVRQLSGGEDFVVLEVGPGLAYDAAGRELILSAPRSIRSVPRWDREPLLAIRSGPGGAAELAWSSEGRLRPCDGVPVARLLSGVAGPLLDPDFHPPAARALARPRIGYGGTTLGGTAWQAEITHTDTDRNIVSLLVPIDTRAAGFTSTPCYFAWLEGSLLFPFEIGTSEGSQRKLVPLPLYPSLEEEKQTGFRLRVLAVGPGPGDSDEDGVEPEPFRQWALATAQQSLALCWLGIQAPSETQSSSEVSHGNP